ncbi:serine/threonine-protein kinase bur1 [Trichophyton rubrum CBS 118892]|uniref:Serine/threonine-protein kinase bur1 n=1 Tax=Trichophyton rubrum (strain ATCC MYA-4607 / CBS 118892) TaxID=559305 RepID=A0A080WLB0_TRIRC|nr:serine/threonine-protein kinase bur1 [Trichophyton rubrum CBS 118892]KFL61607.1 serine/threonine-protein kinase bur1 [Trichophyton rubrum CBS 118892]
MLASGSSPRPKRSLERDEDGHLRFQGCSSIREFEFLGKLGEGTFGEVYKARSKRAGSLVALKKILMHNEKDGVGSIWEYSWRMHTADPNIGLVSNHCPTRDQTSQDTITSKHITASRNGSGTEPRCVASRALL